MNTGTKTVKSVPKKRGRKCTVCAHRELKAITQAWNREGEHMHYSIRDMAKHWGLSKSAIHRHFLDHQTGILSH